MFFIIHLISKFGGWETQLGNLCLFYMSNFERIDCTIRIERIKCVCEISDDFFISAIKRTPKLWLLTMYNS